MSYEVIYNEVPLHNYFDILKVTKRVLPKRTNFTKDIPSKHGLTYLGYKYEPKEITLECLINADNNQDLAEIIEYIAFILDVKNPSKLIISDNPNKYYLAVINDTDTIEQIRYNGKFNLVFICYNPIAYSVEDDFFDADSSLITTVSNTGTSEAYPKVSIEFSKDAHFLQCTNYDKRTILVGTPPDIQKPTPTIPREPLKDNCETLSGWTSVSSSSLDSDRDASGSIQINGGGYALTYGNLGTSTDKWHGGASRKNLTAPVEQFEINVKMEHNSKGDVKGVGAGTSAPTGNGEQYVITADPSLRIRSDRGTNYSQIGSIPKGKVVTISDISNNWGKTTYNGKTGYISMQYATKYIPSTSSSTSKNQYKITPKEGLNVRSGRGTNYKKVTAIPYNKIVTVSDIQSGWGKVTYNGKTGYISMKYCTKVDSTRTVLLNENPSAESRIGLIEVYGYDSYGAKLFKMKLYDSDKYYEATRPEIEIGSNLVLQDNNKVPAAKTKTVQIDNKTTENQKIDSGKFGDWNEFIGHFIIKRTKNSNGQFEWQCTINKLGDDGKVIKSISTNKLINSKYPTTNLSNIVVYFAQYGSEQIVDVMNVSDIVVTNLAEQPKPKENKPIFKKGDVLLLDFESEKVYKNDMLFMNELDIGSQFFSCPVGNSQFICNSDDKQIDIITAIQKRWL